MYSEKPASQWYAAWRSATVEIVVVGMPALRNCRAHDVQNLYLADGSFFPSAAALNPALTIAANALRIAPKIASTTKELLRTDSA